MSARTYSYLTVLIGGVIVFFFINSFFSPNPRTLFKDVMQGFFVGFGLAFITLQILGRIKAKKVNGGTTMFRCGEPGIGFLSRAACALTFPGPINSPHEAMYWTTDVDGAGHPCARDRSGLVPNTDGSVDIYIQKAAPAGQIKMVARARRQIHTLAARIPARPRHP